MASVSNNLATALTRSLRNRAAAVLAVLSLIMMSGGLILVTASGASAAGNGETPCGTPGTAAYDEVVVDTPAKAAYDDVVHHDAVPAVTHLVHHDAVPAVYVIEYQWTNPPGQGNDQNPGQNGEHGREEKWLPEGQAPNGGANGNGQWVKTGVTRNGELVTAGQAAWDETVVDVPAQDAYVTTVHHDAVPAVTHTVHHAAVPAGAPCAPDDDSQCQADVPALTGAASEDPCSVTPNLPSQTTPTCAVAGTVVAPAEQAGVVVTRTDKGDGKVEFVSTPASGYSFTGEDQSVSTTVQVLPRLTGTACGQVTDETPGTPSVEPVAAGVEGSGTVKHPPTVKGAGTVRHDAQVLGTSAALPTAVDAGLPGQPQDGSRPVRALVGQVLLGGGLLLLVVAGWSGLGRRRLGVPQV